MQCNFRRCRRHARRDWSSPAKLVGRQPEVVGQLSHLVISWNFDLALEDARKRRLANA
ncbi:hypothetical protein D3C78_1797590 [compost metagenome]